MANTGRLVQFLIAALLPTILTAEPASGGSIAGRIADWTGKPVAGARVEVEPGARSTRTNEHGAYRLEGLAPGQYVVTVLAENYFQGNRQTVALSAGETVELNFELAGREVLHQKVVVTGTSSPTLLVDAPVRTELITRRMTEALVKRTLNEALTSSVPGVRVEQNCQNCGFTAVRLNGLEGPYTQLLEDGLPSVSGAAAVYGLDQIPTEFFEQIEVVKGGNSALYGPNAVAGVINLIRKEPHETAFALDTLVGWQKGRPEKQTGFSAQTGRLPGGFAGDFYARWIQRTHIDRDRDGFTEIPRRDLKAGGFTLFHDYLESRGRLVFGGSTFDEFRRGGGQFDLPPEETYITEQLDSQRSSGFLRWQHTLSPSTIYSLNQSFSYFRRSSYYGVGFDPNAYGRTRDPLFNGDYQLSHHTGRHFVTGGFQYWWEHVNDEIPSYNRRFDDSFSNGGLYLQDEVRLSSRLVVVGGFRADKSNLLDDWVLSPRANIRVGLGKNWNWRAGISTGFRPPAIFDEDLHIAATGGEGFVIQRSAGLRRERSVSYTSALDYNGAIGKRPVEAGVSFFDTRLRDNFQLQEAPSEEFRLLERVNGAGSYVRGVDLNGAFRLNRRIAFRGGATFQLARFREAEPQFGSLRFFRTPNSYGFGEMALDLPGELQISSVTDFTGPMVVPHYAGFIPEDRLERSRRFAVWNLVVSRELHLGASENRTLKLYFAGRNLLDDVQPDFDRGPLRDSNYIYGPMQMRQFTVGATWRF